MKQDIRRLVQLQDIAFEIRDLSQRETSAPARLAELEEAFRQRIEEIGAAKLRHESLTEERARLTEERQQLSERVETARKKLMQVKNQREYSAALNEIDATETTIHATTKRIAELTQELEELASEAEEADERITTERASLDADKQKITGELAEIGSRLKELAAKREEITSGLPANYISRFDTIFQGRGGIAMARIVPGAKFNSCGACHVRLRPQVVNLAKRGDDLVTCESCRRILYYLAPEELTPPEPDAEADPVSQVDAAAETAPEAAPELGADEPARERPAAGA